MRMRPLASLATALAVGCTLFATPAIAAPKADSPKADAKTKNPKAGRPVVRPIVVGHRGASGYRPEHTLAAYELAARMGADFIEPDLVPTKDGVLVARHENNITGTTDVSERPEFADRKTTKVIDGAEQTGWFTEDFTLAELKTLRAVERLPQVRPDSAKYDGMFEVPTFEEVLQLRERLSKELGREIGVYPETKHPTYFDSIGLSLEEPLVELLNEYDLNKKKAPVYVQSFEVDNLVDMNENMKLKAKSVFLLWYSGSSWDKESAGDTLRDYAYYTTPAGMRELKKDGIDGLGPELTMIIKKNADGTMGAETTLVDNAHAQKMQVMPYTFRAENGFLYNDHQVGTNPLAKGDMKGQIKAFLDAGIDGLFSDHPDLAVEAVDEWMADQKQRPGKGKGPVR